MNRMLVLVLAVVMLLCGCVPGGVGETETGARVVTQIRVSLIPDDNVEPFRVYTDEEKMHWVLDYIESIYGEENPRKAPENEVGSWRITCVYVNGEEKEYYLREDQYFREEGGNWLRIEGGSTGFTQFLLSSPSDEIQLAESQQSTEETGNDAIKVPPA